MITDKFGNAIFQEHDIVELIYKDNAKLLNEILVENTDSINQLQTNLEYKLKIIDQLDISVKEFDQGLQQDWFIPEEYKIMDIEGYLVHVCPKENYQRLIEELQEYRTRNLLPLLRTLKYIVDTLKKNNIVWGVGRGSSVASYVLFLLEVHKIDSIKYKLDWQEFLR